MPFAPKFRPAKSATAMLIVLSLSTWGVGWPGSLPASPATAGPGRNAAATHIPPERPSPAWTAPPGFVAASPPAFFAPDTLFEIINGDAELYLKAGFTRLETRRFTLKSDQRQGLTVFNYQMERHRSAFAVYSVRRGEEARPSPLTRFAYRYKNGLFLVHGPFYVEILASDESPRMIAAMNNLASAFIESHAVAAEPIPELDLFPPEGLVHGSKALHPANAFGFDGFTDLFTARYRLDGQQATAFIRPCSSPRAAAGLANEFRGFLAAYDGVVTPGQPSFSEGSLMRVMDAYTLVFVHGHTVAGVQDAGTPKLAARLARALKNRLIVKEGK